MKKRITIKLHDLLQYFAGLHAPEREINSEGNVDILVSEDIIRDFEMMFHTKQTNFTTTLLNLIMKADRTNLIKLSRAYPEEVFVIMCYQNISGFVNDYYQITKEFIS